MYEFIDGKITAEEIEQAKNGNKNEWLELKLMKIAEIVAKKHASYFAGYGLTVDVEEVVQASYTMVHTIIEKYDVTKGASIETFATVVFKHFQKRLLDKELKQEGVTLPDDYQVSDDWQTAQKMEEIAEQSYRSQAFETISEAMKKISDKQREALTLYFGLDGEGMRTQAQVGALMGRNRDCAKSFIDKGLAAIRRNLDPAFLAVWSVN